MLKIFILSLFMMKSVYANQLNKDVLIKELNHEATHYQMELQVYLRSPLSQQEFLDKLNEIEISTLSDKKLKMTYDKLSVRYQIHRNYLEFNDFQKKYLYLFFSSLLKKLKT